MHEGYTLKDLMRPDRLRVQKALSGIINLQKFKESVQEDYDRHVRTTVSRGCAAVCSISQACVGVVRRVAGRRPMSAKKH